jgi:hypothetical protein
MPRRKKKWMLLRGKKGNFIVVSRDWYDSKGMGRRRGRDQMWVIAAESDDHGAMQAMASLTGRHVYSTNLVTTHD